MFACKEELNLKGVDYFDAIKPDANTSLKLSYMITSTSQFAFDDEVENELDKAITAPTRTKQKISMEVLTTGQVNFDSEVLEVEDPVVYSSPEKYPSTFDYTIHRTEIRGTTMKTYNKEGKLLEKKEIDAGVFAEFSELAKSTSGIGEEVINSLLTSFNPAMYGEGLKDMIANPEKYGVRIIPIGRHASNEQNSAKVHKHTKEMSTEGEIETNIVVLETSGENINAKNTGDYARIIVDTVQNLLIASTYYDSEGDIQSGNIYYFGEPNVDKPFELKAITSVEKATLLSGKTGVFQTFQEFDNVSLELNN